MKLLLDTHILIWMHTGDIRLSQKAKDIIGAEDTISYYSAVSVWESDIKHHAHAGDFAFSGEELIRMCNLADLIHLPLTAEHVTLLGSLKYSENAKKPHKDPFDRMLLAQAKSEGMFFMTHDSLIPNYNEDFIISV